MQQHVKQIEQLKSELNKLTNKVDDLKIKNKQLSSEYSPFLQLFDTSKKGIRIIDKAHNIIHVNQSFLKMVDKTKEETIGKKCFEILPTSHCHTKSCPNSIIKKNITENVSFTTYHKVNKIETPYTLNTKALLDEDNNYQGIIETYETISAQINAKSEHLKLVTAFEQSNTMVVITNVAGKIEYANSEFCKITGYILDKVKPVNIDFLNHPNSSKETQKEIWDTILKGETWKGELYNKTKNKKYFWESASISPILDSNKKITNFIKVAVDITDRKKIEEQLKDSESRLKNILENSPRMFYSHTADHILTYISPQIHYILGISPEEGLVKWQNNISDNPINKKAIKITQLAIDTGIRQAPYELELIKKSGERIFVEATEFPVVKNGKTVEIVGSIADITERKKAERIQSVIYNISNAVLTTESINDFIKIIKYELNSIIDTTNFYIAIYDKETDTFHLPYHIDEKDSIVTFPAEKSLTSYVTKTKKPLLATIKTTKKLEKAGQIKLMGNDSKIWLGVPLISNDKAFGTLAVQSYDDEKAYDKNDMKVLEIISGTISIALERQRRISDLKLALEKAKESDQLKSAFLSNMSHEIRTPMNGILGFIQLLNDPFYDDEEKKGFTKVINRGSIRLLNTINDMIDISKIEAGQMLTAITETSINNLFMELFEFFKPETSLKNIDFSYKSELSDKDSIVLTDNDKLHAMLRNLIKNAIKYTDHGSIKYGCRLQNNKLEIYVKDTGVGIPKNRLKAIFNRFEQADIEDKRALEGSGLGLAITKSYVEMLAGEIIVKSTVGEGSEFTLIFPYKR